MAADGPDARGDCDPAVDFGDGGPEGGGGDGVLHSAAADSA